jgi:hypothetical protein
VGVLPVNAYLLTSIPGRWAEPASCVVGNR